MPRRTYLQRIQKCLENCPGRLCRTSAVHDWDVHEFHPRFSMLCPNCTILTNSVCPRARRALKTPRMAPSIDTPMLETESANVPNAEEIEGAMIGVMRLEPESLYDHRLLL